jgi:hypothetical protein
VWRLGQARAGYVLAGDPLCVYFSLREDGPVVPHPRVVTVRLHRNRGSTDVIQQHRRIPTFVDLFSGCGGISLGFQEAGFRCLLAVDNDPQAVECYNEHLRSERMRVECARATSARTLTRPTTDAGIDLWTKPDPRKGPTVGEALDDLPPVPNGYQIREIPYSSTPKNSYQRLMRAGINASIEPAGWTASRSVPGSGPDVSAPAAASSRCGPGCVRSRRVPRPPRRP